MHSSLFAIAIAGIGLFFIGSSMLSNNMKKITGQRMRHLIARWTNNNFFAGLWGIVLALIVQRPTIVAFIIANLVASKMLSLRRALHIVSWANPGNTLLIFIIFIDIRLAILYLIGIAGIGLAQSRNLKMTRGFGALFGFCLMFYGMSLIQDFSQGLKGLPWTEHLFSQLGDSHLLLFLLGSVISIVVQSVLTVIVLAISLADVGLLSFNQTMMIAFGAYLGTGLLALFFSRAFSGVAKQTVIFQGWMNICSSLAAGILIQAEQWSGIPLLQYMAESLFSRPQEQLASMLICIRGFFAVLTTFFPYQIIALLDRFWPAPESHLLFTKTRYIHEYALEDPHIAINLIEKEHLILFKQLHRFLDYMKSQNKPSRPFSYIKAHQAFLQVINKIRLFTQEILASSSSSQGLSTLAFNILDRNQLVSAIEDNIYELSLCKQHLHDPPESLSYFVENMLEAMDSLLLCCLDMLEQPNNDNIALLLLLTSNKGIVMAKVRHEFLQRCRECSREQETTLLSLTDLFERSTWALHRYAECLDDIHEEKLTT